MTRKLTGLTAQIKQKLIQQSLERRLAQPTDPTPPRPWPQAPGNIPEQHYRFALHPGYQQLRIISEGAARLGLTSPFFKQHHGTAGAHTRIDGRDYLNFASYNYLNLNGDPRVNAAACDAIHRYGSSVSASRLVSGERPIHRQLETALAQHYGVDDAVCFVSGHATNVSTIGHLFGPRDLILHDEYIHNSALQGIQLSGAHRLPFPHNDWAAADRLLTQHRHQHERVLLIVEGLYSMDGDYPDLPRFIELRQRHRIFLMVDEAHSLGVMGPRGHGIREHFSLSGQDVDIWMGTLSKTLAGCGGYIAGESALIEHLKCLAPGFLYSVGLSPALAAASLTALQCLHAEPQRVSQLQARGALFLQEARAAGIPTGTSQGLAIIPAITGSSIRATRLAAHLLEQGIHVQPILYPAVPEQAARLRFFLSCAHSEDEIHHTVRHLAAALRAH